MNVQWHCIIDGEQHGPLTAQELKGLAEKGKLKPSDLVWHQGVEDWTQASDVKGLFPSNSSGSERPPTAPPRASGSSLPATPSVTSNATTLDARGPRHQRPLGVVLAAMYSALGAISSVVWYYINVARAGIESRTGEFFSRPSTNDDGVGAAVIIGFVAILYLLLALLQATAA